MNIALDVDGVVCDWWGGIIAKGREMGLGDELPRRAEWVPHYVGSGKAFNKVWNTVREDRDWWMSLRPYPNVLARVKFPVHVVITARPIPAQWTVNWFNAVGLTQLCPRVVPSHQTTKAAIMLEEQADLLVDDNPEIVANVNLNFGLAALLLDQSWNRLYDVGDARIKSLTEVPERVKAMGRKLGTPPPPLPTGGLFA